MVCTRRQRAHREGKEWGDDSREKMKGGPAWGDERVGESLRVLYKKIEDYFGN